tara:strand:- start:97 stop:342 length:246 start_codon:yes stop_codon:yes gene_type:complete
MSISETKKKPIIEKLNYLEKQIDELKNIINEFIRLFNKNFINLYEIKKNEKIEDQENQNEYLLIKEEIEKLQKKKGWLWDY